MIEIPVVMAAMSAGTPVTSQTLFRALDLLSEGNFLHGTLEPEMQQIIWQYDQKDGNPAGELPALFGFVLEFRVVQAMTHAEARANSIAGILLEQEEDEKRQQSVLVVYDKQKKASKSKRGRAKKQQQSQSVSIEERTEESSSEHKNIPEQATSEELTACIANPFWNLERSDDNELNKSMSGSLETTPQTFKEVAISSGSPQQSIHALNLQGECPPLNSLLREERETFDTDFPSQLRVVPALSCKNFVTKRGGVTGLRQASLDLSQTSHEQESFSIFHSSSKEGNSSLAQDCNKRFMESTQHMSYETSQKTEMEARWSDEIPGDAQELASRKKNDETSVSTSLDQPKTIVEVQCKGQTSVEFTTGESKKKGHTALAENVATVEFLGDIASEQRMDDRSLSVLIYQPEATLKVQGREEANVKLTIASAASEFGTIERGQRFITESIKQAHTETAENSTFNEFPGDTHETAGNKETHDTLLSAPSHQPKSPFKAQGEETKVRSSSTSETSELGSKEREGQSMGECREQCNNTASTAEILVSEKFSDDSQVIVNNDRTNKRPMSTSIHQTKARLEALGKDGTIVEFTSTSKTSELGSTDGKSTEKSTNQGHTARGNSTFEEFPRPRDAQEITRDKSTDETSSPLASIHQSKAGLESLGKGETDIEIISSECRSIDRDRQSTDQNTKQDLTATVENVAIFPHKNRGEVCMAIQFASLKTEIPLVNLETHTPDRSQKMQESEISDEVLCMNLDGVDEPKFSRVESNPQTYKNVTNFSTTFSGVDKSNTAREHSEPYTNHTQHMSGETGQVRKKTARQSEEFSDDAQESNMDKNRHEASMSASKSQSKATLEIQVKGENSFEIASTSTASANRGMCSDRQPIGEMANQARTATAENLAMFPHEILGEIRMELQFGTVEAEHFSAASEVETLIQHVQQAGASNAGPFQSDAITHLNNRSISTVDDNFACASKEAHCAGTPGSGDFPNDGSSNIDNASVQNVNNNTQNVGADVRAAHSYLTPLQTARHLHERWKVVANSPPQTHDHVYPSHPLTYSHAPAGGDAVVTDIVTHDEGNSGVDPALEDALLSSNAFMFEDQSYDDALAEYVRRIRQRCFAASSQGVCMDLEQYEAYLDGLNFASPPP